MFSSLFSSLFSSPKQRFRKAAEGGNLDGVKRLYKRHGSKIVNAADKNGWTALHYACLNESLEVIRYLVEECNAKIMNELTPLQLSSANGKLRVIKFLVETTGANIRDVDEDGLTLLHIACIEGKMHVVQYLVEECDADINAVEAHGCTPLELASAYGKLQVVKYLVEERGADIPFELAFCTKHALVAAYLQSRLLDDESNRFKMVAFHAATKQNNP
jgi:ankyrin repeat protein